MSTIDPLWTKVLAGPPTCNVQSDIYLTMILLIVDPAPKSLLLWGMGFSPCIFQTPMVYGAILHPKKNVLEKGCVILILETPQKKMSVFFTFFKRRSVPTATSPPEVGGKFFRVFSAVFAHGSFGTQCGVQSWCFYIGGINGINGETRHLPTGGERGGNSGPDHYPPWN